MTDAFHDGAVRIHLAEFFFRTGFILTLDK